MARQGFTAQRPLHRAYEQDATLVQAWVNTELPALRKRAKDKGAVIMFVAGRRGQHASRLPSRNHLGAPRTYAHRQSLRSATFGQHDVSVGMDGQFQFMLVDGRSNAATFKAFLHQLLIGADKPIILVVDGHPIHKEKLVKEFIASTDGKLELCYLPPYSPQLNPDEQV